MNWKKIFAVVSREYVERIRTKAFWIATLLIPLLLLGYVAIQIAISRKTGGQRELVVVDLTGKLYKPLAAELADTEAKQKKEPRRLQGPPLEPRRASASRATCDSTKEALRKEVLAKKISGYLILEPAKLEKEASSTTRRPSRTTSRSNQLQSAMNRIWLRQKMAARGLPADIAAELETPPRPEALQGDGEGRLRGEGRRHHRGDRLPHPHVLDVLHVRLPGDARRDRGKVATASSRSSSRRSGRPS